MRVRVCTVPDLILLDAVMPEINGYEAGSGFSTKQQIGHYL